jgi:hypothetical protein
MTHTGTVGELFETAIALEQGAEELYRRFAAMFPEHPTVEKFWLRYADEEQGHASYLEHIHSRLPAAELDKPGNSHLLEAARKTMVGSVDELLQRVHTLADAYDLALELENSETNAIFEFILLNFSGDELGKSQTFLRVQLHRHLTAFEREFPAKYKSRLLRQEVKANPPSA